MNTKQKIAVLASGLAIATTGFVTDADASNKARGSPSVEPAQSSVALVEDPPGDEPAAADHPPVGPLQLEL